MQRFSENTCPSHLKKEMWHLWVSIILTNTQLPSLDPSSPATKWGPIINHTPASRWSSPMPHSNLDLPYRITECSGLEGTSVGHPVQPPAEAGSPRAGCTGPRPGGSWISPRGFFHMYFQPRWPTLCRNPCSATQEPPMHEQPNNLLPDRRTARLIWCKHSIYQLPPACPAQGTALDTADPVFQLLVPPSHCCNKMWPFF